MQGYNKIYILIVLLGLLFLLNICLSYFINREHFDTISTDGLGMKMFSPTYDIEKEMAFANNLTGNYDKPVIFHCYWDGQLNEKHIISLKSCYFFNVLNRQNNSIILWTTKIADNEWVAEAKKYVSEIRVFNLDDEKLGTPMEKYDFSKVNQNPSFFSDVVRYTLLYKYGGCWFDLDVFFFRCLDPLFVAYEDEIIVYQWDTENHPNGAVFISLIPRSEKMKKNIEFIGERARGWGFQEAVLTFDLPMDFLVLPCSWFDPYWREDNPYNAGFDDFFKATDKMITFDDFCKGSFTFHWHNRWGTPIENESPIQQLNSIIDSNLQT